jgi:arylsulfatase A
MDLKHCIIVWLIVLMAGVLCAAETSGGERPNVVFILIDNCGQEWFGCYGSEEGCTPRMDRLAQTGLRVENCYTPVVCGPSRITALTGRYLLRSGFTYHHDAALYSGGGFPSSEITFARLFRDAGYKTGIVGKWQINNLYDEPDALKRHGFDESLVCPMSIDRDRVSADQYAEYMRHVEAADPEFTSKFIANVESRYWDPVFLRDGKREKLPGEFGPDVAQKWAVDFVRRHRDERFLLYYPMFLVHGKTFTEHVLHTPANVGKQMSEHELFADMVRYTDKLVGDFFEELDRLKLRENTIVFVATDNGTATSITARARGRTVRGGLYTLSEPGGNVVLFVNCPGRVDGGRTLKLADFSDLLPTFCEAAGIKPPTDRVIDGRSFAPAFREESSRGFKGRDWMFNQYGGVRVVSDGRFKLYSDGRLFDVTRDFEEHDDLSGSPESTAVVAKTALQAALDSLPPDAPAPIELRSQSIFRAKQAVKKG